MNIPNLSKKLNISKEDLMLNRFQTLLKRPGETAIDGTIWKIIKWEAGPREIVCSRCFSSEISPYVQYYHYPDTRWIKTQLGSFRVVALAMEQPGNKNIDPLVCKCTYCGEVRNNDLFVHRRYDDNRGKSHKNQRKEAA